MAITINSVKCPECGANLPIEEGRTQLFCSYCGAKVIVTNENEHIYRHVDEASIKQAETEAMVRLKELELEEKENNRNRRALMAVYIFAFVLIVIGIITYRSDSIGGMLVGLIGLLIAEFTFIGNQKKKNNIRRTLSSSEAQISQEMHNYVGKHYNGVLAQYKSNGFTNVSVVPLRDLNFLTKGKNGQVEKVTINGSDKFDEGDIFDRNSSVIITYHSAK